MAVDVENLRLQLRNFRTRAAAIDEAVNAGRAAVEPVIQLLNDRNEATRWSAMKILAEIGDTRGVGPLIALLERGKNAMEAANALRTITGRDFGEDAAAWRKWASDAGAVDGAQERPALSDQELMEAATKDLPAGMAAKGNRYAVKVSLPNGRSQRVRVDFGVKDSEGEPLVRLYTPCGKAGEERYEWALRNNMNLPYGAIAIARIEGERYFVMVNTYLRATVDPEDISKTLMTLAAKGDAVEKILTGEDRF